jgi:glycogen synthase
MSSVIPVSVVISTLNRPESLRRTLISLRYQRYPRFEVLVVDGPSDQPADGVTAEFAGTVRYLRCQEANLSKSRNLGIAAASGDIVAFIDDDAVPEPGWLEELVTAYDRDQVAGAGGIVFDFTGTRLQYRYSESDRVGRTFFTHSEGRPVRPGSERFPYLQGTNMSFRRELLAEIGGFDEEIEYNFDEVEVCLQLIDQGYSLVQLAGAAVHHKYLPSHVRNADRVFTDPYLPIKNRVYFALRYGRAQRSTEGVLTLLHAYLDEVRESVKSTAATGKLTRQQVEFFLDRAESGFERGLRAGLENQRQSVEMPVLDGEEFQPFARLEPEGRRLRGCFLSQEYPPGDFGGVGRYTAELAEGFAGQGHEIHVFTRSPDEIGTVDFEGGCWVHRVPAIDKHVPELEGNPAAGNLYLLAANLHEVNRCREREPVDFVSAPLWLSEGLCCCLDPTLPTITTLVTTMKTISELHPSWAHDPHPQAMLRLERETVERSSQLHAISQAILDQVRDDYPGGAGVPSFVVPLGIADRLLEPASPRSPAAPVQVLFVGRLERRKGVDVLLEAARELLRGYPEVSFVLAGKDTPNTEQDRGYRELFQEATAGDPDVAGRVRFTGAVTEDELWRLYRECDIFCAPSRFESFGLVLVEAMMFGKPVVGCATGGMSEIIEDGVSGLLAAPGDAGSLAGCLRRLLDDEDLRSSLGKAARARYLAEYELDGVVARTLEAYQDFGERSASTTTASPREASAAICRGFAEVIARVGEIEPASALRAAEVLLDPAAYPIDLPREVERMWNEPPDAFIAGLYRGILGRFASEAELRLWSGSDGQDWRIGVASGIGRSAEAESLGVDTGWLDELERRGGPVRDVAEIARGLEALSPQSDSQFVSGTYELLLGREPEPAAAQPWVGYLTAGAPRLAVIVGVASSGEARARGIRTHDLLTALGRDGDVDELLRSSWHLSDDRFMTVVYGALLGREPDEAGRRGFVGRLRAGLHRLQAVREIANSPEAAAGSASLGWLQRLESAPPSVARSGNRATGPGSPIAGARALGSRARRQAGAARRIPYELRGLQEQVAALSDKTQELTRHEEQARHDRVELGREIDGVRADVHRLLNLAGTRDLDESLRATVARVGDVAGDLERLELTVDVLRRKQEAVSLDLRELMAPGGPTSEPAPPEVLDPVALENRVASIGGVRLNLGCGEKPLPDYINVDFRALPDVDIVADVRRLPYGPGEVDEIASAHLVEHFRQHQLEHAILPYWGRLLREGGVLRVVCPNWAAMLERVHSGEMRLEDFKTVTFGLQDYDGDDHFAMYSPELLSDLLSRAGFRDVEIVEANRRNGMSTEMELTARKPAGPARPT